MLPVQTTEPWALKVHLVSGTRRWQICGSFMLFWAHAGVVVKNAFLFENYFVALMVCSQAIKPHVALTTQINIHIFSLSPESPQVHFGHSQHRIQRLYSVALTKLIRNLTSRETVPFCRLMTNVGERCPFHDIKTLGTYSAHDTHLWGGNSLRFS